MVKVAYRPVFEGEKRSSVDLLSAFSQSKAAANKNVTIAEFFGLKGRQTIGSLSKLDIRSSRLHVIKSDETTGVRLLLSGDRDVTVVLRNDTNGTPARIEKFTSNLCRLDASDPKTFDAVRMLFSRTIRARALEDSFIAPIMQIYEDQKIEADLFKAIQKGAMATIARRKTFSDAAANDPAVKTEQEIMRFLGIKGRRVLDRLHGKYHDTERDAKLKLPVSVWGWDGKRVSMTLRDSDHRNLHLDITLPQGHKLGRIESIATDNVNLAVTAEALELAGRAFDIAYNGRKFKGAEGAQVKESIRAIIDHLETMPKKPSIFAQLKSMLTRSPVAKAAHLVPGE